MVTLVVPALVVVFPAEALSPAGVGPRNPLMRGFPAYFVDDAGHALRLCVSGRPKCDLTGRRDLRPPEGEAFYWSAATTLRSPGINVDVEFALEAAFAGQRPLVFDRLRIRGHVSEAGTYTINHPYGTTTVRATTPDEQRNINFTRDIGCAPGPRGRCSFASATRGRITTFLKQVGAPRGFFGNPARPRPVVGGETVSISGPAGTDTSSRFSVLGQRAKPRSVAVKKLVRFGNVDRVGNRRVRMLNIGLERIRVRKVRLLGDNAFSRVRSPRSCGRGDVLLVGRSCTVGLRYTANGGGASKAQLRIRDNSGRVHTVHLRAAG